MSAPRQRLLDTAGRLFTERGYECVGINEIIAKAEIAKATFYQHFPSKEGLCAAWLREEAAQAVAAQNELLRSTQSLRRKITTKFARLADWAECSRYRGCPFSITASMVKPDSEVGQVIRDYKASARRFWQDLARQIVPTPAAAKNLGDTLFLLYSGASTEAQNLCRTWPIDQAKKTALSLVAQATK